MKKKHIIILMLIMIMIAILIIAVNNVVICSVNPQDADYVYGLFENEYNTEKVDICIFDYDFVTGTGWRVEKSTNEEIENTYVCLETICNPRYLKINEAFDLDYLAKYVAVIDKNIKHIKADNEDVNVLKAKEIVITNYYRSDGAPDLRFRDLTFAGKIKSFASLFIQKLRMQM